MKKRISIKIDENIKAEIKESKKFRFFADFVKEAVFHFLERSEKIEFYHVFWDMENRVSTTFMSPINMLERLESIQMKTDKDIAYLVEYSINLYYKFLKDKGIL